MDVEPLVTRINGLEQAMLKWRSSTIARDDMPHEEEKKLEDMLRQEQKEHQDTKRDLRAALARVEELSNEIKALKLTEAARPST